MNCSSKLFKPGKTVTVVLWFCVLLQISGIVNLQCATEKVHPLLYGPGTWHSYINSVEAFANGETLVGGKSFSTKTAGEGFLMRIDKYGKPQWQKLYQSTAPNEDLIEKVSRYYANSYAVGHSLNGSSKTFFVLKFSQTGVLEYNYKIGVDTTKVDPDSSIVYMYARSYTEVITVFGGSTKSTISFMTLDAGTPEAYLTVQGASNSLIMYARRFSATTMNMIFIYQGKMAMMYYDSTTDSNTKAKYITNDVSTFSPSNYRSTNTMRWNDEAVGWIAAITTNSRIYGFLITTVGGNYASISKGFNLGPTSAQPIFISAVYFDMNN